MALDRRTSDLLGPEAIRPAAATIHPELAAELGITVEGAAAASWAGLLADADPADGAAVVVVTGSNVAR